MFRVFRNTAHPPILYLADESFTLHLRIDDNRSANQAARLDRSFAISPGWRTYSLPLALAGFDASPVRAVLRKEQGT